MFILFGLREKEIKVPQNQKQICPNCGEQSVLFFFFIKYVHIFWVPAFPYGKHIVSHCEKCESTFENKYIPEPLQMELDLLRPLFKTPIYIFSATFLIIALLLYLIIVGGNPRVNKLFGVRATNGMQTYYYPSGEKEATGEYIDGEMHGKWVVWFENGVVESIQFYNIGLEDSIWKLYYPSGRIAEIREYQNGLSEGKWSYYYENGNIQSEVFYKQHRMNGDFITYYDNGSKEQQGKYVQNLEEGEWDFWFENGQLGSQ